MINSVDVAADYAAIKAAGFAVTLGFAALVQILVPYKKNLRADFDSWLVNIPLAVMNSIIFGLFCSACACTWSIFLEGRSIGLFNAVAFPWFVELALTVLMLDFVAFAWHRANHRLPFLWRFHAVHHSESNFDASTALRFHIGELLISLGVRLALVTVLGISVSALLFFELIYQFFNVMEHGNIRLWPRLDSALSRVFIVPALHRRHHSTELLDQNSNFGVIFSFWDRFFGFYRGGSSGIVARVGLSELGERKLTVWELFTWPFRRA